MDTNIYLKIMQRSSCFFAILILSALIVSVKPQTNPTFSLEYSITTLTYVSTVRYSPDGLYLAYI